MIKVIYVKGNNGPIKINRKPKKVYEMSVEEQMKSLFGLGRK